MSLPLQSPAARRERGRIGALSRSRAPDDPDLIAARRFVAYEGLERQIRRYVGDLTAEDRARLAGLLAGDSERAAS